MIIEVRPTPTLRRHRARIVGAVAGIALLATTLVTVAELASVADLGRPDVAVTDPSR
jgi:hypothetical protein